MTEAYFNCVNDNGGINGRPIQYMVETEQTDPGQIASLAKKLIETDKVVGIVGNTSLIECAVNHKYYESKGFYDHRRGHRARVLLDVEHRGREHGPALQRRRRRAVRRSARRSRRSCSTSPTCRAPATSPRASG